MMNLYISLFIILQLRVKINISDCSLRNFLLIMELKKNSKTYKLVPINIILYQRYNTQFYFYV